MESRNSSSTLIECPMRLRQGGKSFCIFVFIPACMFSTDFCLDLHWLCTGFGYQFSSFSEAATICMQPTVAAIAEVCASFVGAADACQMSALDHWISGSRNPNPRIDRRTRTDSLSTECSCGWLSRFACLIEHLLLMKLQFWLPDLLFDWFAWKWNQLATSLLSFLVDSGEKQDFFKARHILLASHVVARRLPGKTMS